MVCDICNAQGKGTFISEAMIRQAVALGFNPYKECICVDLSGRLGTPADFMFESRKQKAAVDNSDWNVCDKCMGVLSVYVHPENTVGRFSMIEYMIENLLKSGGVPCNGCKKTVRVDPAIISAAARKLASGVSSEFTCPDCGNVIILSSGVKKSSDAPAAAPARLRESKKWWRLWK